MGVAAEVADHLLGPTEWSLGIDDPFLAVQGFGNAGKVDAAEIELPFLDGAAQRIEQLAAEQTGKDFDRKQESPLRGDPSGVVSTQSTAGHDAVHVGVKLELSGPRVQHGGDAERAAESLFVLTERQQ